jgi:hypothetical protein
MRRHHVLSAEELMNGCVLRLCGAFLVLIPLQDSLGDDPLLLRSYVSASAQYEGMRVVGNVSKSVDGEEVDTFEFQANYGKSTADSLRPYEIGAVVKNPGEPQTDAPYLFTRCFSVKNNVAGEFNRAFFTDPPHRFAMSKMFLRDVIHFPDIYFACHLATQFGIDGAPMDSNWGNADAVVKNLRLDVLQEETFLGFPCKRVKYTYRIPMAKGLSVELLVADNPSIQVLEVIGVDCDDPIVAKAVHPQLLSRVVEELKVIDGKLIPTRVLFNKGNEQINVVISKVEPLPANYAGTWDYESLTGTVFSGPADAATRDESKRVEIERLSSILPFTQEEAEAIRQYRLSKLSAVPQENGWFRYAIIAANCMAVVAFFVIRWLRYRRQSQ